MARQIGIPSVAILLALLSWTAHADPLPALGNRTAQFTWLRPVRAAPSISFRDAEGRSIDLGRFRGKVVLLNFWATWCIPCVYEMPALDRLQAKLGGRRFSVVAVSIDKEGKDVVAPFFRRLGLTYLAVYLDPDQRLGHLNARETERGGLALYGFPISYIIDTRGDVLGYIVGATDWDSQQAVAFLRYFMERGGRR